MCLLDAEGPIASALLMESHSWSYVASHPLRDPMAGAILMVPRSRASLLALRCGGHINSALLLVLHYWGQLRQLYQEVLHKK